ncbi:alcohol dehydrogenase catalytic domain-containing protein [Mesorhizobium amorphae]|uniref:alcohol dehydrogenase catalytic domain-containing protein n=1 Tax=Mesorhizobium amorphae TaxID=71433 RepID=UPI0021B305E4|nr:alcohol dehydrogenase catalytic domain-containing protein [Mesorhizobium amorphae]
MKAIVLQDGPGVENLRVVDRPQPVPRRQEILIRVRATALNYRDVEIVNGSYHTAFALPLVPLSDGVGEVVAIGEEVTRFKVGDRVCSTFWQRWLAVRSAWQSQPISAAVRSTACLRAMRCSTNRPRFWRRGTSAMSKPRPCHVPR